MFIECSLNGNELHSHNYYANTDLFKKLIEKFIEKTVQLESNSEDEDIEVKKKIIIYAKNLLINLL